MNHTFSRYAALIIAVAIILTATAFGGTASAAGSVYVNDGNNVLGMDINAAYAVGGSGSVSVVGDSYVLTGSGTVKIGQAGVGELPTAATDGAAVSLPTTTARIGLYYYYNSSRDTTLSSANLENKVGSGYIFGYYDSGRVFHEVARTAETKLTMKPTGSGREVSVYRTGTDTVLYTHSNSSFNLAIRPVSASGKAETWFKGYTYYGDFEYYRYISDKLTVINVVNVEDYVKGVLPIEMSPSWPSEALKAQALCARTYFATSVNNYSRWGFDITADTYCQAYLGTSRATANSDAAVDATAGQYVTYNGALCSTFFFSSDGGGTENSENVFQTALPYLRGVIDPYEDAVPASMNAKKSWHYEFTSAQIVSKLSGYGITNLASITPTYSATGNVIQLTFTDTNGNKATIAKTSCYSVLGLPSLHYTITKSDSNPDLYLIDGSGWGHSVGMSQFGAYSLAKNYGCSYRQIIGFYYTGVNISTGV